MKEKPPRAASVEDSKLREAERARKAGDIATPAVADDAPKGYTEGAGQEKVDSLDDFFNNPKKFGDATPNEWYQYFKGNGYNPQPMSKGGLGGIPLDQGGGFKVNWGGDRIWEYHPSGLNHHGGDA